MTESVELQMRKIFDEYIDEVQEQTNKTIDAVAKAAVLKLKSTSPKRSGKYARSWTKTDVRTRGKIKDVIVHNKEYQLTHLLENGHIVRNKKGTYGRAPAHPHIAPVEQWAIDEFESTLERKL